MSHGKRRKETNCLNCGSELHGPYCHFCGQENLAPKESAWGLVSHFLYDITHFDGKFFHSMKYLLFRPGFLAREYMRGRRASYLNPIRMYVFTSAFFFILFFSFSKNEDVFKLNDADKAIVQERLAIIDQARNTKDTVLLKALKQKLLKNDSTLFSLEQTGIIKKSTYLTDSLRRQLEPAIKPQINIGGFDNKLPKTVAGYDSVQAALSQAKRDGWLKHFAVRKLIQTNEKYHDRPAEFQERFIEKFLHSIPKLMFVSLPFVSFLLWVLYVRQKRFYYVNHAIHVIYIYIALYFLILVGYLFSWLYATAHWDIFNWLQIATALFAFYYIYKSLRNFYEQPRIKTFFKYLVFLFVGILLFVFLAIVFVLNSFLTM